MIIDHEFMTKHISLSQSVALTKHLSKVSLLLPPFAHTLFNRQRLSILLVQRERILYLSPFCFIIYIYIHQHFVCSHFFGPGLFRFSCTPSLFFPSFFLVLLPITFFLKSIRQKPTKKIS